MSVEEFLKDHLEDLTGLRHELHQYPDLSGEEKNAARILGHYLQGCSPDLMLQDIGGHGIVCGFRGKQDGPSVMLRSELDGLPIEERNTFAHRSKVSGVSHKCGHEGHSAILAGMARYLSTHRPSRGQVLLLFQPAEEIGAGAAAMLADPRYKDIEVDYAFALHNLTDFPFGSVILKDGAFNSSTRVIVVRLLGNGAHPADAGKKSDPGAAMLEILHTISGFSLGAISKTDFQEVNILYYQAGEPSLHTSPGEASFKAVLRTGTDEQMAALNDRVAAVIQESTERRGLEVEISWLASFDATNNHPRAAEMIRRAARQIGAPLIERQMPIGPSDDFFLFMNPVVGAIYGVGAGEDVPRLHSDLYDFPDALIPLGIRLSVEIVNQALAS